MAIETLEQANERGQKAKEEAARIANVEAECTKLMSPKQINELKRMADKSKVAGVSYTDIPETERAINRVVNGKDTTSMEKVPAPIPTHPPWTTWSGFMIVPSISPFVARFKNDCGAIAVNPDGTVAEDAKKAHAFAGFWTSP